jgi:dolichol-phosphate mannosyltransferase
MITAAPPAESTTTARPPVFAEPAIPGDDPHISIIVPGTDDESALAACYEAICERIDCERCRWEIIFVDHGTSESAWVTIHRLVQSDPEHVRAFLFTRNQDRAHALALGYREARGELVFTLEPDLDDDPREISSFLERIGWEPSGSCRNDGAPSANDRWKKILPRGIARRTVERVTVAA